MKTIYRFQNFVFDTYTQVMEAEDNAKKSCRFTGHTTESYVTLNQVGHYILTIYFIMYHESI
jgi:hypothetical protein